MGLFDGTSLERAVTCERCGAAVADCSCPRDAGGAVVDPAQVPVRVTRQKVRGKWTTVVSGLDAEAFDLADMLKRFRKRCSAGGSVTADGVQIQGDHKDTLLKLLKEEGFKQAKGAGG